MPLMEPDTLRDSFAEIESLSRSIEDKKADFLRNTKIEMPLFLAEMLINSFFANSGKVSEPQGPLGGHAAYLNQMQSMRDAVNKLDPVSADDEFGALQVSLRFKNQQGKSMPVPVQKNISPEDPEKIEREKVLDKVLGVRRRGRPAKDD